MPASTSNGEKAYFTAPEVARICGVHRNTILAAIRAEKIKAHRTPGGHARIKRDDLIAYCDACGIEIDWSAAEAS